MHLRLSSSHGLQNFSVLNKMQAVCLCKEIGAGAVVDLHVMNEYMILIGFTTFLCLSWLLQTEFLILCRKMWSVVLLDRGE